MNMSKIPESGETQNKQIDIDGDKMLKMMANMQKNAELDTDTIKQNSSVNSPSTIHQNQKVDNVNYWEIKGLPTRYKLYPPNTTIEARPLKVIEVKKLASINESNADYVINDIIKRCVRVSGIINTGELFLADKLFIIFWLRGVTYRDSSYKVDFTCAKCKNKSKYHFKLDALNVDYLSDDYDPDKTLTLSNADNVKLRFLKIKDEFEIERFIEINQKTLGEIDSELLGLACMITDINGDTTKTLAEKYNYVLDITAEDLSDISSYTSEYDIGVDSTMSVECAECGGVAPLGVRFYPDFFLPKRTIN